MGSRYIYLAVMALSLLSGCTSLRPAEAAQPAKRLAMQGDYARGVRDGQLLMRRRLAADSAFHISAQDFARCDMHWRASRTANLQLWNDCDRLNEAKRNRLIRIFDTVRQ